MAAPKLILSASRDIPFNKLVLSQSNVRTIKTGVSIDELAEDIARRTLLQASTSAPFSTAKAKRQGGSRSPPAGVAIARWNCW